MTALGGDRPRSDVPPAALSTPSLVPLVAVSETAQSGDATSGTDVAPAGGGVTTAQPITPTDAMAQAPTLQITVASAAATTTNELATPTLQPTAVIIVPPTLPALTNEQRWRAQQTNRVVLDPPQPYTTSSSELWWYDPINQQNVILGSFAGSFDAQARFTLLGQGVEALEVPYEINKRYGLTSLSDALVARMRAAGNDTWVETYVFVTPNIVPR